MQLRGFQRISLKPGEKKTVEFAITPETLAILDINMNRVVEPGMFDIMIGPSSAEAQKVPLEVIAK
jgi:beta-glucosidase